MEKLIHTLAIVLPIIALSSVILVVCVNLYLKVRRKFSVKVNCWFCNQWTKVRYDEQNCFECPTCLQYNGFDANGDYNKQIPAQHDELLNQQVPRPETKSRYSSSNGLCHLCNNNQQLRIYQLANFIPLNEANFDIEVEHFQKQLDKAYKLCSVCENVVKKTIRKQNCLLGLKFSQLRKKGLLLLDLNNSYNGISKKAKWSFLQKLLNFTLLSFAFVNLLNVIIGLDLSERNLKQVMPKWTMMYILLVKDIYLMIRATIENIGFSVLGNISGVYNWFINAAVKVPIIEAIFPYVNRCVNYLSTVYTCTSKHYSLPVLPQTSFENATLLCLVGMLLQVITLLWNDTKNIKRKLVQMLMWTVLTCIRWHYPTHMHSHSINALQIVASTVIISSMCFTQNPKNFKPKTSLTFEKEKSHLRRKLRKSMNKSLGDLSDNEEFDKSFSSPHNSTPKSQSSFHTHSSSIGSRLNDTTPVPKSRKFKAHPAGILESHKAPKPFCDTSSITTARDSLNQSFTSARSCISDRTSLADTASNFNSSFLKQTPPTNPNMDLDIDISLNKLHLGNPLAVKAPSVNAFCINTNVNRPRPVISPAKLRNVTQNSWVAGGFWRDCNGVLMPVSNFSNISRSSSQTSGFVSQTGPIEANHFNSLPSSLNNSICGDPECNSVLSEPMFDFNGSNMVQARNFNCYSRVVYQNGVRIYHPVLNNEQLVYISPNCLQPYNNVCDMYLNKGVVSNAGSPNNSISPVMQKKYY